MKQHNRPAAKVSSFHLPLRFLLPAQRRAMHILYGFCRNADDAADSQDAQTALHSLQLLRDKINAIFEGRLTGDPLRNVITRYQLNQDYFHSILDGMAMDLQGQMVGPSLNDLKLYCYRVAGCVGLLSLPIFGADEPEAKQFAVALGHALQLTNILRDVIEDAARGRLYLPREWLAEEGITNDAVLHLDTHAQAFERICLRLAGMAEAYFEDAQRLSFSCNRRRLLPALLMRDVYLRYLKQMLVQKNFLRVQPLRLNVSQKLVIILRALPYLLRA